MAKKNKIPKNRPISEMMGEKEDTITMQDAIEKIDEKEKKEKQEKGKERKAFAKKIKNMSIRKDNKFAEEQRKVDYLKAISKIEEKNKEQEER